jgi:hypothetical protein
LHRIFLFGLKIFVEDILGPESSPKISSVAPGKTHITLEIVHHQRDLGFHTQLLVRYFLATCTMIIISG